MPEDLAKVLAATVSGSAVIHAQSGEMPVSKELGSDRHSVLPGNRKSDRRAAVLNPRSGAVACCRCDNSRETR
jgi:hypothetical protein